MPHFKSIWKAFYFFAFLALLYQNLSLHFFVFSNLKNKKIGLREKKNKSASSETCGGSLFFQIYL